MSINAKMHLLCFSPQPNWCFDHMEKVGPRPANVKVTGNGSPVNQDNLGASEYCEQVVWGFRKP